MPAGPEREATGSLTPAPRRLPTPAPRTPTADGIGGRSPSGGPLRYAGADNTGLREWWAVRSPPRAGTRDICMWIIHQGCVVWAQHAAHRQGKCGVSSWKKFQAQLSLWEPGGRPRPTQSSRCLSPALHTSPLPLEAGPESKQHPGLTPSCLIQSQRATEGHQGIARLLTGDPPLPTWPWCPGPPALLLGKLDGSSQGS